MTLKYISLFSGIGGFEVSIHKRLPSAECIGYSEIKPYAIKVYEHHYPNHKNLGDISKITDEQVRELVEEKGGCDLIVAGFPCTNLSSMAAVKGNHDGLEGPKSGLFYELTRIIKVANPKYIIIENNNSMTKCNRKIITDVLNDIMKEPVYMTMIDASEFGVQTRKRLYWTNFPLENINKTCEQTWRDVLEPLDIVYPFKASSMINCFNKVIKRKNRRKEKTRIMSQIENDTYEFIDIPCHKNKLSRWELSTKSDTMDTQIYVPYPVGKSRAILANTNMVIDRRTEPGFIFRYFSPKEIERLFWLPDDYTNIIKIKKHRYDILGNTVVVRVIDYILENLLSY